MRNGVGFVKAKLAVAFWVFTALIALPAQAQTTVPINASVDTRAGLVPLYSLDCHGVDFGLWYVPIRSSGGKTFITLTVSANNAAGATTGTASGNIAEVSLYSGYPPKAGTCYILGSPSVSLSLKTSIAQNVAMEMGGLNLYTGRIPTIQAEVIADLALTDDARVPVTNGAGSFRVVGVLTIPETIVLGNHGGYQTKGEGRIIVSDEPDDPIVTNQP